MCVSRQIRASVTFAVCNEKTIAFLYAFIAAFGALVVGLNLGGISGALLGGRLSDKFGSKS